MTGAGQSLLPGDKQQDEEMTCLATGRFRLDSRKKFHRKGGQALEQNAQESGQITIPESVQ